MTRKNLLISGIILVFLVIGVVVFIWFNNRPKEPVRIGFLGVLSGVYSIEGVRSREGILLAVEKKNAEGGINGRPIELIIKDDQNIPEVAKQAMKEFIDEGVVAILAHSSSTNTLQVIPILNETDILMIGDAGSALISGYDDNYFRIDVATNQSAQAFAKLSKEMLKAEKIGGIIDMDNPGYTEVLYNNFKDSFLALNGKADPPVTYNSSAQPVIPDLVSELGDVDVALVVGSEAHMALITQHIRMKSSDIDIIVPYFTTDYKEIGGSFTNGVYSNSSFDDSQMTEELKEWGRRFNERFNDELTHTVIVLIEACEILFQVMEENKSGETLKETLYRLGSYEGFQGSISFDPYGEVERNQYIIQLQDNEEQIIGAIEPLK